MEILCRIREVHRAIAEFETRFEARYGLSLNEGMLLCELSKREQMSSGEIAEAQGLTPSNASKVIRSVEQKGFVVRVMGEHDRRQMYFHLTDQGAKLLSSIGCAKSELPELLRQLVGDER